MAAINANKNLALRLVILLLISGLLGGGPIRTSIPVTQVDGPDLIGQTSVQTPWASDFAEFRSKVENGVPAALTGVYAPNILAMPVVQQPANQPSFVSTDAHVVTQFAMASQYGTTGLLAHNNLAGAKFYNLDIGQELYLIYGDGSTHSYEVSAIQIFQALQPESPFSMFVDPQHPEKQLSSSDMFLKVYGSPNQVVFQTCYENNGNPSWGRIFITATPVTDQATVNQVPDLFNLRQYFSSVFEANAEPYAVTGGGKVK